MSNEFKQSKTKVPMRTKWYYDNRHKLREICEGYGIEHKKLYHTILHIIGEKYNLKAANEIYEKELGYPPAYAIDVVGYFPELEELANDIVNSMIKNLFKDNE